MFIRESASLPTPFDQCRKVLLGPPDRWLPHVVRQADEPGGELLVRLGFSVLGVALNKRAAVRLGEPEVHRDWVRIPIRWEARPAHDAFPVFEGEISLAPLDASACKLQAAGTYEPPLGQVGSSADTLVMRQAARATVKTLVQEVAALLRRSARSVPEGVET